MIVEGFWLRIRLKIYARVLQHVTLHHSFEVVLRRQARNEVAKRRGA